MTVKIGSRKSQLALWQTKFVASLLQIHGVETEIIKIDTIGDQKLDTSIAKIGSKGVFTEEIESELEAGTIDIAVHSAKDMQSKLPKEFEILAFTVREECADVIVGQQSDVLDRPNAVIGTSSTRRKALFRKHYPHVKIKDIRGNLNTRFDKLRKGEYDAIALAYAGVKRLGFEDQIICHLEKEIFVPAVGQGSIAVECHQSLLTEKRELIREAINDPLTESLLIAERAFLAYIDGGCSIPVFANCTKVNGEFQVLGGIISLDGKDEIKMTQSDKDPIFAGETLAKNLLNAGGARILSDIRSELDNA